MADVTVGLTSAGGYVPRYRLSGKGTAQVWGGAASGERAVANYDEDALTMACEAALDTLAGRDTSRIGACFFASTSPPYIEKSNATLLATVADLPASVLTADLCGSLRAGTTALRLALETVRAGSVAQALVAAADMRPVEPGGELELLVGDGAGAALVGADGLLATFIDAFAVSREFTDLWRNDGDRYVQSLPDQTFVRAHGLDKHIAEAVDGLLQRTGRKREDIGKLVLYGPDARTHAALARMLRLESAVPAEPVIARAGSTGTASCLLGLAAALEEAEPHQQLLVVSYGNGAEALLFEATEAVRGFRSPRPIARQLAAGRPLAHYGKFLRFRRHVATEVIKSFSSVPTLVREERQNLRLYGQRCADCGAVSYPRRHLCWQCSSTRLVDHRLARRGRVFTFTRDHLVPNPDPPTVMAAADLEGGGRFYAQVTDVDPATVAVDMPVELTFRRLHEGEDYVNYFWKLRPVIGL
ncbi:MAG TPA: OB-fold domain-containing protein [Methylomirabilota bacterium]|jgi:3-hydroxy-3-methylglutaryl CoA synthase